MLGDNSSSVKKGIFLFSSLACCGPRSNHARPSSIWRPPNTPNKTLNHRRKDAILELYLLIAVTNASPSVVSAISVLECGATCSFFFKKKYTAVWAFIRRWIDILFAFRTQPISWCLHWRRLQFFILSDNTKWLNFYGLPTCGTIEHKAVGIFVVNFQWLPAFKVWALKFHCVPSFWFSYDCNFWSLRRIQAITGISHQFSTLLD